MRKRHQTRSRRKPRASSADVLAAPVGAAPKIRPKWRTHYQNLVRLRSQLLDRKALLGRDTIPSSQNPASTNHIADAATDAFDRDLALSMISSEQDALYEIDSAIKRIEEGTYGICELTGKKIDPERLEVIPWTRFSTEAEKQLEHRGEIRPTHLTRRGTVAVAENAGEEEEQEG
jgi:RNA polymerase-binding transcription factor DksA